MTKKDETAKKDELLLEQLRELLLQKDRQAMAEVRQLLDSREELSKRVDPIIESHLELLKENFPDNYLRITQKIIDARLKESEAELANILYPRLGKMVNNYIADQFRLLREKIDNQIKRSPFSFLWRSKNKTADEIIVNLNPFKIEEIYVVSHESGLLLGSASASQAADKDMVAGMLTAIKAFVEDAFNRSNEELRGIRYRNYEILVHNFFNYYIAIAIVGTISESDRQELSQRILSFATHELNTDLTEPDPHFYAHLQRELTSHFMQ